VSCSPAEAYTRVTLTTDDGVSLAATVWEPPGQPLAGIVLVHGPSRTRRDWDRLAEQLAMRGFVVIAVDLRGHGDSGAPGAPGDLATMALDVTAAAMHLLSRPDVRPGLGVVGASAGGTLAVLATRSVPSVRSFVFLSTPLDFRGLRVEEPLRKAGERAALVIASNEDVYAARSARALAEIGPGPRELMLVEGAGHGARILASRPDLVPVVVDWFVRTLL
jgi:alpha-beta hydrolase superfamily lysophospholipase